MAISCGMLRTGEILDGKYAVERVLGEGGMGIVVAAHRLGCQTPVAVKLLRSVGNDIQLRRFLREVRGTCLLRNEHVARVYDFGHLADGRPYMAMELLDGPDLASMLDVGPLPQRLAAAYVFQVCHALAEAHARGIVHRDIKPANLMLSRSPDGEPIIKVVDFGIATAAVDDADDEITAVHSVIGSITYMSPEQLRSAHEIDGRSDIWSLGVTLYELISGRLPFSGDNFAAMAVAIATDAHLPLVEAPPELAAIVDRCLAKDPDDRYATITELAEALAPFVGLTVTYAAPVRPTEPELLPSDRHHAIPVVKPRRNTGWIAAGVAAVLALASFGAIAATGTKLPASSVSAPVVAPPAPHFTVEPIVEPAPPPAKAIVKPKPATKHKLAAK